MVACGSGVWILTCCFIPEVLPVVLRSYIYCDTGMVGFSIL